MRFCQEWLDIKRPSYDNLNKLIIKVISPITASFHGGMTASQHKKTKKQQRMTFNQSLNHVFQHKIWQY